MKTLIVQRRILIPPESLDRHVSQFLEAARQVIEEAREKYRSYTLELEDIGFSPGEGFVEIKLYFREPEEAELKNIT
ncbi:MAG TPA: hypothetical protein PKO38_03010 [Bacillota bacterium]|jgi:hypothetical protein|nr:hypothetical protein [Bacillota bacterium]HOB86644.1 hypothetical protein [Bacillota bacterium]HOP68689.1 hypothetical protein [Bacillota bacterium]HPT33927.1 hypothetical protein [Bacillota bacterium]HPZ64705.1 hypothetical protein [Bacillota bacterium]